MAEANPQDLIHPEMEEFAPGVQSNMVEQIQKPLLRRSATQVTIFLYGKSGDGKSSTLNHLFGTDIIPTRKRRSDTREVTEYGCSLELSQIEKNINIGFIDSPGFDDTEGEDAENLAKISHFIETHPELGNSKQQVRVYPNIVLVVISASDDRLSGIYSIFSKMLHVLSKLNVVDKFYPNVVIAVTHAMYFSRDEFDEETKHIEKICRILTRAHFSIEVPVVFIENLDKKKEMEQEGDWKILPDGTKQPLNLFDAMIHLMNQSRDKIGIEAVRLFFHMSTKYKVSPTSISIPSDLKYCSSQWKEIIEEKFFSKKQSIIYEIISTYIGSDSLHIFPMIYNLQKKHLVNPNEFLNYQMTDIQKILFPYEFTSEEKGWLIHLFEVSRIKIKLDFELLGCGYSTILKKSRKRILELGPMTRMKIGNYEVEIPETCSIKEIGKFSIFDIVHEGKVNLFRANSSKLMFRICYILFQVEVDKIEIFDPSFISKLKNSFFTEQYHERRNTFIEEYSQDCIILLSFGDYIDINFEFSFLQNEQNNKMFLDDKSQEISLQLENFLTQINNGTSPRDIPPQFDDKLKNALQECKITWRRGSKKCHSERLSDITVNKLNDWKKSIQQNSICLDNIIKPVPLYKILKESHDEEISPFAHHFNEKIEKNDLTGYSSQSSISAVSPVPHNLKLDVKTRTDASGPARAMCILL